MKYIRTKDGRIVEYQSDFYKTDIVCGKDGFIFKDDILKQADTIEELCDEFVWIDTENNHNIKPKTGDGLWCLCCDYKNGQNIYGAIWTDKGLIYVAKMNDKGELELL